MSSPLEPRTRAVYQRFTETQKKRVIRDLLNLDKPLEDIVDKYNTNQKYIYTIARQFGLDMATRNRIFRMKAERKALSSRIKSESERFKASVIKEQK